jgi:hypothetical protein
MGEAHPAVPDHDHVGLLGLVERSLAVARHGLHERDRWLRHCRGGGERAAGLCGQRFEPSTHELVERDREPLSRLELNRALPKRTSQLESKERVAAGELVQAPEGWAWGQEAEPFLEQMLDGAQAQRRQLQTLEALRRRRAIQLERDRRARLRSPRRQQRNGPVVQPPHGVAQHESGGGVEPLYVVYRYDEWLTLGELAEDGEHRERDALLVGRVIAPVVQQQRNLERAPLARGQLPERIDVVAQQVAQGGVCEARLRLGGPSGERKAAG